MEDTKLTEAEIARIELLSGCCAFSPQEIKDWLICYINGWRAKTHDELVNMIWEIQARGYCDLINGYTELKPEFDKPSYSELEAELTRLRARLTRAETIVTAAIAMRDCELKMIDGGADYDDKAGELWGLLDEWEGNE